MKKNITLSLEESTIQLARRRAAAENTTINDLIRFWLEQYAVQPIAADIYQETMDSLGHVNAGGKYSRDEMNERR